MFDLRWAAVALFVSLVSGLCASAFLLLRLGLDTPLPAVAAAFSIACATVFSPHLLPRRGFLSVPAWRALAFPLVGLGVLASVMAAFWLGRALLPLYPLLALAGMASAARFIRGAPWRGMLALAAGACATAAYLFVVVNNQGYAGVYTPEQSLLGLLNHDTRLHTAVTYMIQNFGTPSFGVDGILPLRYHIGAHAWLAAFGLLAGVEPVWSYSVVVPTLGAPLLMAALCLAGLAIDVGSRSARTYIACALILLLISDTIGWNSYYISETYTFGLVATMLLLPLLMRLAQSDHHRTVDRIGFAIAVAAILPLMSLKVSVGVLWGVATGWIALRRYGFRGPTFAAGAAIAVAFLIGLRYFSPGTGEYVYTNGTAFALFYILRAFPEVKTLSSFVLPACLVVFALTSARMNLRQAVAGKADFQVETAVIVTLVGALPPFLGIPQDSGAWYFLNVGQWYAMVILASRLSVGHTRDWWRLQSQSSLALPTLIIALFVVSTPVIESVKPVFQKSAGDLLRAAERQAGSGFLKERLATQYFRDALRQEHVLFGADFRRALAESTGSRVITEAHAAFPQPRRDAGVYIPPENAEFWDFQQVCRDKHNVQVSLTGLPSILGGPPRSYNCIRDAYQNNYGERIDSRALSREEICIHASTRDIARVLVLRSLRGKAPNEVLQCRKDRE